MRKSPYINFLNARSILGNSSKALSELDDMEQIIRFLAEGDRYDEIASKKQMPVGSIKRKCTEIREHFHCKTNAQLVYKYVKGEIDVFRLI
ncbi:MAG: hypothetical protein O2809_00770 [Proteobacteria bacterium]|nr:hypothetical protein [Pseudomonadota bacterium]